MLVIRLQRTGRKNTPAFRVVLAEKRRSAKKRFLEVLGHYLPAREPPVFEARQERIAELISKGAQPSDTVARLLKRAGMKDMDRFITQYTKKKPTKEPEAQPEAPPSVVAEKKEEVKAAEMPVQPEAPQEEMKEKPQEPTAVKEEQAETPEEVAEDVKADVKGDAQDKQKEVKEAKVQEAPETPTEVTEEAMAKKAVQEEKTEEKKDAKEEAA